MSTTIIGYYASLTKFMLPISQISGEECITTAEFEKVSTEKSYNPEHQRKVEHLKWKQESLPISPDECRHNT